MLENKCTEKKKGNRFLNMPFRQHYSVEDSARIKLSACFEGGHQLFSYIHPEDLQHNCVFLSEEFQVFISLSHCFHPCFGFINSSVCQFATCYRKIITVLFRKGLLALFFLISSLFFSVEGETFGLLSENDIRKVLRK